MKLYRKTLFIYCIELFLEEAVMHVFQDLLMNRKLKKKKAEK